MEKEKKKWLTTYTKRLVAIVLFICLIDLQLSYILAFLGKEQIAESLSITITTTIVGVIIGYLLKALFETFFEEREKRLNKTIDEIFENSDEFCEEPEQYDFFETIGGE